MDDNHSQDIAREYPMSPPIGFSTILTTYNLEHHQNNVPVQKASGALELGGEIFTSFDSDSHCLRAICLLLSDVPLDPLVSATQTQKASVLGLTTLGFVANDRTFGPTVRSIVEKGDGVIILRLSGPYEAPEYSIETFQGRAAYSEHLSNLVEKGSGGVVKNSTLL
jgi:hypothetical protein